MFRPHPLCWKYDIFQCIHYGIQLELLEVKLTIVWALPYDWVPWSFHLPDLSILSLQQFVIYRLGFPTLVMVSMEGFVLVSCDFLYFPVYLFNFGGSNLLYGLTSEECWFFSSFGFLVVVRIEWWLSNSLYLDLKNLFCSLWYTMFSSDVIFFLLGFYWFL